MIACTCRRLGLTTLAAAMLLLLGQAGSTPVLADKCNSQKAVLVGCPLEQKHCGDFGCATFLACTGGSCYETLNFYSGNFRCDPISDYEKRQFDKWMCYQQFAVGPLGIYPVVQKCLDIRNCRVVGFGTCVPDNNSLDSKYVFVYDTSNNCDLGS